MIHENENRGAEQIPKDARKELRIKYIKFLTQNQFIKLLILVPFLTLSFA